MGRNGSSVKRVGHIMMHHGCRPPYPLTRPNTATLLLRNQPTNIDKLHRAPGPPVSARSIEACRTWFFKLSQAY